MRVCLRAHIYIYTRALVYLGDSEKERARWSKSIFYFFKTKNLYCFNLVFYRNHSLGRLGAHQVNEPEGTSSDSHEAQDQREGIEHREDSFLSKNTEGDGKILDTSPSTAKDVASVVDAANDGLASEVDLQVRTLEGSFREETATLPLERLSKVESEKQSTEEVVGTTGSMEKDDTSGTLEKDVVSEMLENTTDVETCKGNIIEDGFGLANKESFKTRREKGRSEFESSTSFDAPFGNDLYSEDKEQVDSARGKSVELSSDSRDSVLMREGENDFSRTNTPIVDVKSDGHKTPRDPNKVKIVQMDSSTKSSTNEEEAFSSKGKHRSYFNLTCYIFILTRLAPKIFFGAKRRASCISRYIIIIIIINIRQTTRMARRQQQRDVRGLQDTQRESDWKKLNVPRI